MNTAFLAIVLGLFGREPLAYGPGAGVCGTGVRQKTRPGEKDVMAPFLIYLTLCLAFFGLPVINDPFHTYMANSTYFSDSTSFIWFLNWWPYAFLNGLNPFLTDMVWAPEGVNLAWTTATPGAALLAAPVTLTVGPVVAYNALSLLALPLSAWSAYALCRYITQSYWPAFIGGYIFGFSPYEIAHLPGHLSLILTFIVPLIIYLVVLRLNGAVKTKPFIVLLAVGLAFQFLISNEIFATLSVLGVMTMFIAILVFPLEVRKRLLSTIPEIFLAYVFATLLVSPYLYYMSVSGAPRTPIADPEVFSSDLLGFIIPTPIISVGDSAFGEVSRQFLSRDISPGNFFEATAYLGLPLVVIIVIFASAHWHSPIGKVLILSLLCICLFSMGPILHIAGIPTISLPWKLMVSLPLVSHAMPARLMMFGFLLIAVLVALWLSSGPTRKWVKIALVSLTLICIFPNVGISDIKSYSHWLYTSGDTPDFFSRDLYRKYLCQGEITLILPYAGQGNSMLWQALSGMYFRMAAGYVNTASPPDFYRWRINETFVQRKLIDEHKYHLKAYLTAHQIRTIIIPEDIPGPWDELFSPLGISPIKINGVLLYRLSTSPCNS